MAVDIIEYFDSSNKNHWIRQLARSEWEAAKYLSKLLSENKLRELCGDTTKLFLLVDGSSLCSFCTLAEQDEIKAPEMTPWIGFVHTLPDYRGNHYATKLINYVCDAARDMGYTEIFCSPSCDTLDFYEKLGFEILDYTMLSIYGYETSILHKNL